ncbi:MAG: class I SAM-dependent methyltransferase [Pseudomonadota bacterium]|nr:class I SAM-dependent methyltransferase [Pseudomonadota bacterium]
MLLTRFIKNVLSNEARAPMAANAGPRVLNVGGNSKQIALPPYFAGWAHVLLDIAPGPDVDVVLDSRQLLSAPAGQYDAVYCSHNLEHYYRHDCRRVLAGFRHVLTDDGFVDIRVPDMAAVLAAMVTRGMDIDDVLYVSSAGPISVHDVIYGYGVEIERSGVDFFAHKRGFTEKSLLATLDEAGFGHVHLPANGFQYELRAFAFKAEATAAQKELLGLDGPG